MRQTAAIQLSLDRGHAPVGALALAQRSRAVPRSRSSRTRRTISARTPGIGAFARTVGVRSIRTRTGVAADDDDPAAAYTRFALGANDMLDAERRGRRAVCGATLDGCGRQRAGKRTSRRCFPKSVRADISRCGRATPSASSGYAAPIVLLCRSRVRRASPRERRRFSPRDSRALLRAAGVDGLVTIVDRAHGARSVSAGARGRAASR